MIEIRACANSDVLPCSLLLQEVYAEPPYQEAWSASKAAGYLAAFFRVDPKGCFVAIDQGRIVGCLFSYSYPWSTGVILFIQELFVSRSARRKGVRRELVARAVVTKGKDLSVALIVREGTDAARLYEKLGLSKSRHYVLYSGKVLP